MHGWISASGGVHASLPAASLLAVVSLDSRDRVSGWSDEAEAILGYRSSEVVGRPAIGLVAEGRWPARTAALVRCHGSGRVVFVHKSGFPVEATLLVEPAVAAGHPCVWFISEPSCHGAGHDIGLLEGAWTQSSTAISVWSSELRLLWANELACQIVEEPISDVRGRRPTEVFLPDSQHHALEEQMRTVRDTGTPRSVLTYERVAGRNRPREWVIHIDPVRDLNGAVVALCTMARDNSTEFWARQRLCLLDRARRNIGLSLDTERTARELTSLSVPDFADVAFVQVLPHAWGADRARSRGPVEMRLIALSGEVPSRPHVFSTASDDASAAWRVVDRESLPSLALSLRRAVRVDLPHEAASWPELPDDLVSSRRGGAICVPLTARGAALGVATFLRAESSFDAEDLLLVEELAETTATCMANARHYEREHSTALTLQQSLLPREPPAQSAVDAAYAYRPADVAAGVGGDWFDVIPLSGARVALVIGDVVGRGVRAAATMGRLRSVVRTLAEVDLSPEELLTSLDDTVNRVDQSGEPGAFDPEFAASILYSVYDPTSRRCCFARAAHVAPVLVRPSGDTHLLDLPEGPPLGLGGLPFESVEMAIPEGSMLVFFTDGVVGTHHRDLSAGISLLQEYLASTTCTPAAVCDDILELMLPKGGGDDAAVLVARSRVIDEANIAQWDVPADASAVAPVRDQVTERLGAWGLDEKAYATEIIVSELVTNAVRYGRPPIRLRLIRDSTLICEVTDGSSAAPHLRRARSFDEGGRGLFLVAQLSSRWGSRHLSDGKIIWAEQQLQLAG
ncbi:SpoIIE family protein phosphatase [Streptomyces cadmiisoli]|uniref:SpoIIE family protein phosphatase n=1 Tax=Streptomyces cadmiisoli TaxID=2184053 RepID=UPI003D71554D